MTGGQATMLVLTIALATRTVSAATLALYDTGTSAGGPLATTAMTFTSRWTAIPVNTTTHTFSGDAVLINEDLAVVWRQRGEGADIYTSSSRGRQLRATLSPVGAARAQGRVSVAIVAYGKDDAVVDAWRETESGKRLGVRYRLDAEAICIETEPLADTTRLRVAAPHRYAVVPYSSGDDIVIDGAQIAGTTAEFSGENWLAQMLSAGDVILMIEWDNPGQDFQLSVAPSDSERLNIRSSDITFGQGGKIYVTALEHEGLWRVRSPATDKGAGEVRLTWRWFGPAPWRPDQPVVGQYRDFESGGLQVAGGTSEPFVRLYDTGSASEEPLPAKKIAGCTQRMRVPEEQTDYAFQGDAVLMNDKLVVVLRRNGEGAEMYARSARDARMYAVLKPADSERTRKLASVSIAQNGQDAVTLDAVYATADGQQAGLRLGLAMGQAFVRADPLAETRKLAVEGSCRFAVLPDFFADDIVVDALDIPADVVDLSGENFLLQLLANGEAILMTVWDKNDQDVRINLAGSGPGRLIQLSTISLDKGNGAWVALMADPGIWHMHNVEPRDKGHEIPLSWRSPFPALWRVDWRRADGLTDSWEMLTQRPDGTYKKHGLFSEDEDAWTAEDWWGGGPRTRIASGLGRFHYPCWVNMDGAGYLEPMVEKLSFQGPAIVYPVNRLVATPLDKLTVVDIVRGTMGVGPCKYILDVEGQSENFKGIPTCSVRDLLEPIYEKGAQQQERAAVEKALVDVVDFITLIRKRIDAYGAFAQEMVSYLETEKGKTPDLSAFISEMEVLTQRIEAAISRRQDAIRTIEYAAGLAGDFRKRMLNYTGADALEKCKTYTREWVNIGGNQDELVAECRMLVRLLRQRGALAAATDPRLAQIAGEIRTRTQAILRSPVNYEAPRH